MTCYIQAFSLKLCIKQQENVLQEFGSETRYKGRSTLKQKSNKSRGDVSGANITHYSTLSNKRHTHTHTHTQICACTYVLCMCVFVYIYIHIVCVCVCVCVYIQT